MKRKKLVIISHTEHYKSTDDRIVGWGPTIKEVNYLADYWEEVIHIACFHDKKAPESSLPYLNDTIKFVAIPPFGGKRIWDKIEVILKTPKIISQVIKNIDNSSEVQLRLPTSMGLFLLPLFSFFVQRKFAFWIKYAGNWGQETPPLSYKIQKWWLENNLAKCTVTINGFWPNQPLNCKSFENPCLFKKEISDAIDIRENKTFQSPFTFVFIGRLDEAKGMGTIIDALLQLDSFKIHAVHFIGDGVNNADYQKRCAFLGNKVIFHGFLCSEKVHDILKKSHFLLLPSKSEGFPKVIAEAACYGVIPVVSDVGSIAHYINETNGFIWEYKGKISFNEILLNAVETDAEHLQEKSKNLVAVAEMFTFENYRAKLEKYIFVEPNNLYCNKTHHI